MVEIIGNQKEMTCKMINRGGGEEMSGGRGERRVWQ
jgi:hypothetical protein